MTTTTTTTSAAATVQSFPFCPAWCGGHDDDDPYIVGEPGLHSERLEPGMPGDGDVEVGDVIFTHSGDDEYRDGGRGSMWLRRIDRARGGNIVTGGGVLEQGPVMVMVQGEGIGSPACLSLPAAAAMAAQIIATADALWNPEDHR